VRFFAIDADSRSPDAWTLVNNDYRLRTAPTRALVKYRAVFRPGVFNFRLADNTPGIIGCHFGGKGVYSQSGRDCTVSHSQRSPDDGHSYRSGISVRREQTETTQLRRPRYKSQRSKTALSVATSLMVMKRLMITSSVLRRGFPLRHQAPHQSESRMPQRPSLTVRSLRSSPPAKRG